MFFTCSSVLNAEEEGHHEKGPSKVLKKVKEKAKKIKNVLTKHGHGHEHDRGEHIPDDHDLDQEDDEDDYNDNQLHGDAPGLSVLRFTLISLLTKTEYLMFWIGPSSTRKSSYSGEGGDSPSRIESFSSCFLFTYKTL